MIESLAEAAHPKPTDDGNDVAKAGRESAIKKMQDLLNQKVDIFAKIPGVKDIIEYSRAIHAEMDALLSAARSGSDIVGSTLYCTTYPCHNCARHLVTAGVKEVQYIEPYVKSLAMELHSDSISSNRVDYAPGERKMSIVPFTGVGPRMYSDCFLKSSELKSSGGAVSEFSTVTLSSAVRVMELDLVEERAVSLLGLKND